MTTETPTADQLEAELGAYGRDLHALRQHARAIGRYLGEAGVPRGETRAVVVSLAEAGVVDAYDDLLELSVEG